jgi:hypothetical protein
MIIKKFFKINVKLPLLEEQVIRLRRLRAEDKFNEIVNNIDNVKLIQKK